MLPFDGPLTDHCSVDFVDELCRALLPFREAKPFRPVSDDDLDRYLFDRKKSLTANGEVKSN
jgi:hypothetical protein